jgi:hypothetical protein
MYKDKICEEVEPEFKDIGGHWVARHFRQHGDGSPLAIAQSHPYTDGSLIIKLIVPVYNSRISYLVA